ncbi:DUF732 domain-containing protein [Mycobacterium sp.]|uniref:DUF732 domain-containing protein n=2 Tax=Mycobacterium sp. TaxID=1785 RepID=UPI00345CB5DB
MATHRAKLAQSADDEYATAASSLGLPRSSIPSPRRKGAIADAANRNDGFDTQHAVYPRKSPHPGETVMQRFVLGIGGATMALGFAVGLALALLRAPTAHADDASFVAETRALGFQQSDDVLIRMGRSACRFLQPNLRRDPTEVEEHVRRFGGVESDQAHRFLLLSVDEFCPQYSNRVAP